MRYFLIFILNLILIPQANSTVNKYGRNSAVTVTHPADMYYGDYEDFYISVLYIPKKDKNNSFTGKTNLRGYVKKAYINLFGRHKKTSYLFYTKLVAPQGAKLNYSSWSTKVDLHNAPLKHLEKDFVVCAALREDTILGTDPVYKLSSCMEYTDYVSKETKSFDLTTPRFGKITIDIH